MLTLKDKSRFLESGMKTEFFQQYKNYVPVYTEFTTEIKSTKKEETFWRLGAAPSMQEWIDERMPKGLADYGFSLKNKDYEASIAIDKNDLEDDQYGQYLLKSKQMGSKVWKGYDKFCAAVVVAGNSTNCYDGQFFFDTDHSEGLSGTQSNIGTGADYKFSPAGMKKVSQIMSQYKDDTGEVVGIKPTHVMVPTDLKWLAQQYLDPTALLNATDPALAVLKGAYKIIVNPFLPNNGDDSVWYMLDLSQGVNPFIFQNRKPVLFVSMDKDDDYEVFMRKKIIYGIEARFAFGYGDRRQAFRAAGA